MKPAVARRRAWRLTTLLAAILLAVALVPIAIVAVFATIDTVPKMRREIANQQLAIARSVNGQIARYFSIAPRELNTLGKILQGHDQRAGIDRELDAYTLLSGFYEAIYLIGDSGQVEAIGLPTGEQGKRSNFIGQDFSGRDFYRNALQTGTLAWSDSFLSPVTGRMAIAVVLPIGGRVLVGEVGLTPLPDLAAEMSRGTGMSVMLLDKANQLVAHSENIFANQQYIVRELPPLTPPAFTSAPSEAEMEPTEFTFNDQHLVGTASLISGPDWIVVVAQPRVSAYAPITALWQRIGIGILLSLIGAGVAATLVARVLSATFLRYSRVAAAIGAGHYAVQTSPSHIRELDELQANLSQMGAAIAEREEAMRQARDELQQLNLTLEDRVDERTDELSRANQELVQTLDTLQRAQDELLQSEKLAALGAMVAGIAHELNTPIGNSLMAATTLDDHSKQLAEEVKAGAVRRSSLELFTHATQTASGILIRNLRRAAELITSFKQVAVDQTSSQRRNFRLDETIAEILVTLHPTLKKTPFRVKTELATGIWLDSYPGPLGQVITNLINNALLHAFDGRDEGEISVSASATAHDSVAIVIADNGVGIPPDHLPRIFDPFFTTKLGRGGSGLGLNIVHSLVTKTLGGRIRVSSTLGVGTRVEIDLPRAAPLGLDNNDD